MSKMTKALLLFFTAIIVAGAFWGCGKRQEVIESEFAELISVEKVTPENLTEAAGYMQKYLHKLDRTTASHMLIAYEELAARYINTDADQSQVQSLLPFLDEKTRSVSEEKLKKDQKAEEYFTSLSQSYIYVTLSEGQVALFPDYERFAEEFGKEILPAVNELYLIQAKINRQPATENATLQISYDELLQRAKAVESLITEYKDEPLIQEDAKWLYSRYLSIILMGTTNSPVFDYETGRFSERAQTVYSKFLDENPDTSLGWALREYFSYLKDVGYTMDYKDSEMSKKFFDNCARIATETEKRVYQ